jgi:hypothetical protein
MERFFVSGGIDLFVGAFCDDGDEYIAHRSERHRKQVIRQKK